MSGIESLKYLDDICIPKVRYMDPVTISLATGLATKVVGILSPYLEKSAEEFAKAAGQAAYDKSKSLLEILKKKFLGDKEATETLTNFQQKPERYKLVLEDILKEKISSDKAFADELQKHLEDIGPQLDVIIKMEDAEKATGINADEMTEGKAKVDMDIKKGKDVIGVRVGRIGKAK